MKSQRSKIGIALAACGIAGLMVAVLAIGAGASGQATKSSTAKVAAPTKCGLGNGKKATGKPIVMGGIFTKNPGIDFSVIGTMTDAYFKCVNANGGIHGRPIKYIIYTEADEPDRLAALAVKLADSDKVVAIVGNTSDLDCIVNQKFYEKRGFRVIGAGVAEPCFTTPNFAMVNMGPHYSNTGAAQALVRAGADKIVAESSNVPGAVPYYNSGAITVAKQNGFGFEDLHEDVPIQDAKSLVLKLVAAAGSKGGVDMAFIPPEGLKVMLAASALKMVDSTKWSGATPFNSQFIADALGPEWNGKFLINAEFNLLDSPGPDNQRFIALVKQYAANCPACNGSFGQMGVLVGKIVTNTLLALPNNQITQKGVNAAFLKIKNFKSDLWCKPWYFGNLPYHIPNNWDRTVTPMNKKMILKEDCFPIRAVDPELQQTRLFEKKFKLTSGTTWPPDPK